MRSYEAARGLFSFLGVCSWIVIVVGGIVAFGGLSAGSSLGRNAGAMQGILGAAPGIIISMIGFYGLALVQMGRASVDSAEYSQQSLQVARDQLEVSRQALQQGKSLAASYTGMSPKPVPSETPASDGMETATYKGRDHSSASLENAAPTAVLPEDGELHSAIDTAATPQIVHKNGVYMVGDQMFQRERTAKAYVRELSEKMIGQEEPS